jgi:formylglycine-generating enzyme required for sulfatase activity
MGANPSWFSPTGDGRGSVAVRDTRPFPVENVSYLDALDFCRRLSRLPAERRAGRAYRLPTEAEWEYACRAGVWSTPYHFGPDLDPARANFKSFGRPVPVGSYDPNAWGLFDMHGNVWEWCADWFDAAWYRHSQAEDPPGPATGQRRVLRGGGWTGSVDFCRSALRGHNLVDARHNYNGFRVALSVPGGSRISSEDLV